MLTKQFRGMASTESPPSPIPTTGYVAMKIFQRGKILKIAQLYVEKTIEDILGEQSYNPGSLNFPLDIFYCYNFYSVIMFYTKVGSIIISHW